MIDFGLILRDLRTLNGYTQPELSKKINVSVNSVYAWESCAKYPSVENLKKLSKLYGVTLNYLTGIDKERSIVLDGLTQRQKIYLKHYYWNCKTMVLAPRGLLIGKRK